MSNFKQQELKKKKKNSFLQPQKHHLKTSASYLHLSDCIWTAVAEPFCNVNLRLQVVVTQLPPAAGQQLLT